MKKFLTLLSFAASVFAAPFSHSAVLPAIPGPDDQGGMLMPMVSVFGTSVSIMTESWGLPVLASLTIWAPGDTFDPESSWYDLLDPEGGEGALFNSQYGFMLMGSLPESGNFGIRLTETSSPLLKGWNYSGVSNRFDEVFAEAGDQVIWSGSMWHPYFTLPADAEPGTYTATFEIFVTAAAFTSGTGAVDYSESARNAANDPGYQSALITLEWVVVPEPSALLLTLAALSLFFITRSRFQRVGICTP